MIVPVIFCLKKSMPKPGFMHSQKDEVGQLNTSLETYRGHLLEMESIRATQSQKRQHRDKVVLAQAIHARRKRVRCAAP